ncbi:MAG: delta-60 repeat domain-containing protein, partial [Casimicrobium sp.]
PFIRMFVAFFFASCALSAFSQFGDGTGQVRIPSNVVTNSPEFGQAIALQPDGKIVVAGSCLEGFCVLRLNADGSIDTTFNASSEGNGYPGKAIVPLDQSSDPGGTFIGLAIDHQGRIVLAASCKLTRPDDRRFCSARLTPSGTRDTTFVGPAGSSSGTFLIEQTGVDSQFRALHFAQWTSNTGEVLRRLLLVGGCGVGFQCIAVLNAETGALDASFDPPNSAQPNGLFSWRIADSIGNKARGVISQSGVDDNGKIVIAATCQTGNTTSVCITKFNVDGSLDRDFRGPDGLATGAFVLYALEQNSSGVIREQAIDLREANDGRYYLLCKHEFGFTCIYRLNRDGSLDQSFDNGAAFPTIKGRVVYQYGEALSGRLSVDKTIDALLGAPVALTNCGGPCISRFRGNGPIDANLTGPNGDAAGQFYYNTG